MSNNRKTDQSVKPNGQNTQSDEARRLAAVDSDTTSLAKIWAERAQQYAQPPETELSGTQLNLLIFSLHGERYGVEVRFVREIHELQPITPVPRTPDFEIGLFSARGRLISVVDLRAFFGLSRLEAGEGTKIVVVADEETGMEIGFLADDVEDVTTVFQEDLVPGLSTQEGMRAKFTQGIAPGMLMVLNLSILLNDERMVIYESL